MLVLFASLMCFMFFITFAVFAWKWVLGELLSSQHLFSNFDRDFHFLGASMKEFLYNCIHKSAIFVTQLMSK